MNAMQGERVEKLEALLTRIRERTRAPHPRWAILAKDVHRLPTPAPVPVSDLAPTHPRVVAAPPAPAMDEPTTDPLPENKPLIAAKLRSASVQPPKPIEIVPAPAPAKPIPRAKTLLMGAAPVAKSPSSFPPPVAIAKTPEPTPMIETPPPAEEAPVAHHRIVRIASPTPHPAPAIVAPAPASALAPAPTPALHDDLPPLPPAIPLPTAAPAGIRDAQTPTKQASKGWWIAIVVFVLFAALLLAGHHFGLLGPRP